MSQQRVLGFTAAVLSVAALLAGAALGAGSGPARRASASQPQRVSAYDAQVKVSGRVLVTYASGPGCQGAHQCDVRSGTLSWTPGSSAYMGVFVRGRHGAAQAFLGLNGGSGPSSTATVQHAGGATCAASTGLEDVAWLPVAGDGRGGLRFSLYGTQAPLYLPGGPISYNDFTGELLSAGPHPDEPQPTSCGGPVPSDFLALLPSRQVSLSALRAGPVTVDLSGTASFSAGGLTGTARSTIVLHIGRLKHQAVTPYPPRGDVRVVRVRYRIARVSGSIGLDWAANASGCAALDACGLTGTLSIRPGRSAGHADAVAYDSAGGTSFAGLRRALGLAPGRVPSGAQDNALGSWTSPQGSVSAVVDRAGVLACRDVSPLRAGIVGINFTGKRAQVVLGFSAEDVDRDLLRTRCGGPSVTGFGEQLLASVTVPLQALGRRTVILHLTRGFTATGTGGFTWHSHPDLTIVLERTGVDQMSVDRSIFET
jgi:hypothetical protein